MHTPGPFPLPQTGAKKVMSVVAFRGPIRSEAQYVRSNDPQETSGTGIVDQLALTVAMDNVRPACLTGGRGGPGLGRAFGGYEALGGKRKLAGWTAADRAGPWRRVPQDYMPGACPGPRWTA